MKIDWTLAGSVMLSGLTIVFAALIILIVVVILMGRLMGQKDKPPIQKTAPPAPPASPTPPAPVPAIQTGIEEEVVAAISAAVACTMEQISPGTTYAVTSIQRSVGSRPVWGFAGMQQNTRPF